MVAIQQLRYWQIYDLPMTVEGDADCVYYTLYDMSAEQQLRLCWIFCVEQT